MATTIFAVVLVGVVLLRYSFGRRGSRATAALLFVSMVLSVAVPLWLRGPGDLPVPAARPIVSRAARDDAAARPHPSPRRRVARVHPPAGRRGQLPNFGRLLDRGSAIDLATLKPTQAEPVWAAAATGKYPPKNGIRSNASTAFGPRRRSGGPAAGLLLCPRCLEGFVAADSRRRRCARGRSGTSSPTTASAPASQLAADPPGARRARVHRQRSLRRGASEPLRLAMRKPLSDDGRRHRARNVRCLAAPAVAGRAADVAEKPSRAGSSRPLGSRRTAGRRRARARSRPG